MIPYIRLHTREGARVALLCLWLSDAKGRKAIIKTMKPYVVKVTSDNCMCSCVQVALEEYGHVVLMGLFDCVDDTVLVRKSIVAPLCEEIDKVSADKFGAKVLLYALCPRSSKYCAPDVIALLKQGDGNAFRFVDCLISLIHLCFRFSDAQQEGERSPCPGGFRGLRDSPLRGWPLSRARS
jgi:hypothetical protein